MNERESLPLDLIAKILSYLPAKSIHKFRCVSKLRASTLAQSYFTDMFLTTSSSRPRLFFSVSHCYIWDCSSSPQPQYPDENSPIVVEKSRFGFNFGRYYSLDDDCTPYCAPVSGLIFCRRRNPSNLLESRICNPTTGQYVELPKLGRKHKASEFFGYDPIGKQYKILSLTIDPKEKVAGNILTFPCEKNVCWRFIQCPTQWRHTPYSSGICINGRLYYVGCKKDAKSRVLVCFDVRSEEFMFFDEPEVHALGNNRVPVSLSNFNGKLVLICSRFLSRRLYHSEVSTLELYVWVLEDDKKPEWSKRVCYRLTLPAGAYMVGMISTGEIVFFVPYQYPYYVLYFNPERNTLRKVKIQGIDKARRITIFLDHVESISCIS